MPVSPLMPFFTYEYTTFFVGGNAQTVNDAGDRWSNFGKQALEAADALRNIENGDFIGSEGDKYRELLDDQMPGHLEVTGIAHEAVGKAISAYGEALEECTSQMNALCDKARGDHAVVQAAVWEYNAAEVALAIAAATGGATLLAAQQRFAAAETAYNNAISVWDGDISQAEKYRENLGIAVDSQVQVIEAQSRKTFKQNSADVVSLWHELKYSMTVSADELNIISDALQIIGGILLIIPGLNLVGAAVLAVGVVLKGLLWATGNASFGEFLFDAVTSLPGGAIFKGIKAGKIGLTAAKAANAVSKYGDVAMSAVKSSLAKTDKIAELGRGAMRTSGIDPVDMSTGAFVSDATDVHITGVLPLTVTRNCNSSHLFGRALGTQWVCNLDIRIEICPNEVLMLTPDGAMISFPPAPLDGSEVRADYRPWLLSFSDSAYRIRDISSGVVYIFATTGEGTKVEVVSPLDDSATATTKDGEASSIGAGCRVSSLAGSVGLGIEVGISAIVHRTGHRMEFHYAERTGLLDIIRRSDGTILQCKWDHNVQRLSSVSVYHQDFPDNEHQQLIEYEYDAHGRLRRVVNASPGALHYHYNHQGLVSGWTDRNNISYAYRYDDHGRVIAQSGTGGVFTNAAVWLEDCGEDAPADGRLCVTIETAADLGNQSHLELDESLITERLARVEALPLVQALRSGGLQAAGLTGAGRDAARNNDQWDVPEQWLHDETLGDIRPTVYRSTACGDVWRIVSPRGVCRDFDYNSHHQVIRIVEPNGAERGFEFNDDGVLIGSTFPDGSAERITPAAWGTACCIERADGTTTDFEVDATGSVTAITDSRGEQIELHYEWSSGGLVPSSVISSSGAHTQLECDAAGRIIASTDEFGQRVSYVRDLRGNVIESINEFGGISKIEYCPEGWPVHVTNPDGTTISAEYDGEGNLLSVRNEEGALTTFRYTVFDKLSEEIDPQGGVTRYCYNTQLEVIGIVNADNRKWSWVYGLDGDVVAETDYNGITTQFEFDQVNQRSVIIDALGGHTAISWNDLGKVTSRCESDGVETRYRYNERGQLEEISNRLASIQYERDAFGNIIAESVSAASGEQFRISLVDGKISVAVCEQEPVVFEFAHSQEQPTIVGVRVLEAERELAQLGFGSNVSKGLRRIVSGSVVRDIAVDQRGRRVRDLVRKIPSDSGSSINELPVIAGRTWGWRGDSAVEEIVDHLRGKATIDLDAVGRITRLHRAPQVEESADSLEEFRYSAAGAVESMGSFGAGDFRGGGRLASRMEYQGTCVHKAGRRYYTYDALGRVTKIVVKRVSLPPLVQQFRYLGSSGLVSEFSSSDAKNVYWRYTYDPRGRRIAKTCVDVASGVVVSSQFFAYIGDALVGEVTTAGDVEDGVVARFWVHDPVSGEVVGQLDRKAHAGDGVRGWSQTQVDAVFYALVADLAGAPQELIDVASGEVAGRVRQSVFGVRDWDGVTSPLLFAGQYVDSESGWVYNRFRFYDPYAGVYTSQDPLGVVPSPGGAQQYVPNPLTWTDYFGLQRCKEELYNAILQAEKEFKELVKEYGGSNYYNIATMVTLDGEIFHASGAADKLTDVPKDITGTIIRSEDVPWLVDKVRDAEDLKGLSSYVRERLMRRPFHAEQKLLRYASNEGKQPVVLFSELRACPNQKDSKNAIGKSIGRYLTCMDALKEGLMDPVDKDKTIFRWRFFVPRGWH